METMPSVEPGQKEAQAEALSRRELLLGAATAGTLFVLAGAGAAVPAQNAPAVPRVTTKNAGRRFRAYVQSAGQSNLETLKLLPIQPRQVVIRTEAYAPCYTQVSQGGDLLPPLVGGIFGTMPPELGGPLPASAPPPIAPNPNIEGHLGVGIVEEVGPQVQRLQVGDRVIVGVTSHCGNCYMCLQGRPDQCLMTFGATFAPIAERLDGTPIGAALGIGGASELMVTDEEYCVPVFSSLSPAELSLLGDTAATGLAAPLSLMRVEAGSDVVILGAGAIGLAAVQAAKLVGAGQIIVSEPVSHRRDRALQLGATTVLDPNALGNGLVERVHDLTKGPTERVFAGGRRSNPGIRENRGADFVIEAVGVCTRRPKVEMPPDPSGILPMQQAFEMARRAGSVMFLGFGMHGNVSFNANRFANQGRILYSGQQGGLAFRRDIPRFIKLVEAGKIDLKSMITATFTLEQYGDALQYLVDRTGVCPVVQFT